MTKTKRQTALEGAITMRPLSQYQVRYAEPFAKWEPIIPDHFQRALAELADPRSCVASMASGLEWRCNFCDYRIAPEFLDETARAVQAEIDRQWNAVAHPHHAPCARCGHSYEAHGGGCNCNCGCEHYITEFGGGA